MGQNIYANVSHSRPTLACRRRTTKEGLVDWRSHETCKGIRIRPRALRRLSCTDDGLGRPGGMGAIFAAPTVKKPLAVATIFGEKAWKEPLWLHAAGRSRPRPLDAAMGFAWRRAREGLGGKEVHSGQEASMSGSLRRWRLESGGAECVVKLECLYNFAYRIWSATRKTRPSLYPGISNQVTNGFSIVPTSPATHSGLLPCYRDWEWTDPACKVFKVVDWGIRWM